MYPHHTTEHVEQAHDPNRTHSTAVPTNDAYMGYYHLPTAPVIPQFDAIYCSDFTCCGLTIPDLHGLLAHYEDAHCVTFTPDGTHVPVLSPAQSQYSSAASSPRSSFSSSFPPSPVEVPPHGQASAFHTFYASPYANPPTSSSPLEIMPPNILAYGSSLDGALGDNWQPTEETKYCLPSNPFLHFEQPTPPCFVHPSTLIENKAAENRRLSGHKFPDLNIIGNQTQEDDRPEQRDSPIPLSRKSASPSVSTSPSPTTPSLTTESSSVSSLDEPVIPPSTGPVRSNKRKKGLGRHTDPADKPYKCPKAGCVKTYLNPNGLTYHLKKGTCEMV